MFSVVLALAILSLPLVVLGLASSNNQNGRRPDLALVRVRAERPVLQRRRAR